MSAPQEPPQELNPEPKPSDGSAEASEATPLLVDDSAAPMDTTPDAPPEPEETWEDIPDDVKNGTTDEILTRSRLIDNDIKVCLNIML